MTAATILDADGRQYVLDDDGQPVYGVWILIAEKTKGTQLVKTDCLN
jgi:hypothetical protein